MRLWRKRRPYQSRRRNKIDDMKRKQKREGEEVERERRIRLNMEMKKMIMEYRK